MPVILSRLALLAAPAAALAGVAEDAASLLQAQAGRQPPLHFGGVSHIGVGSPVGGAAYGSWSRLPPQYARTEPLPVPVNIPLKNVGEAQYAAEIILGGQTVMASVETGYPDVVVIDRKAVDSDRAVKQAAAAEARLAAEAEEEAAAAVLRAARANATEAANLTLCGAANATAAGAEAANLTPCEASAELANITANATANATANSTELDGALAAAEIGEAANATESANATEAANETANSSAAPALLTNADLPEVEVDVLSFDPQLSATLALGTRRQPGWSAGNTHNQQCFEDMSFAKSQRVRQMAWMVQEADPLLFADAAFAVMLGLAPPQATQYVAWQAARAKAQRVLSINDDGLLASDRDIDEAEASVVEATESSQNPPFLGSMGCKLFSVCFGTAPGSDGLLVLNDTAPTHGPMASWFWKLEVNGMSSWTVQVSFARLKSDGIKPIDVETCPGVAGSCSALLDSGSSLLAVPMDVLGMVQQLASALDSDCEGYQSLPSLTFLLGGKSVVLPPSAYLARVVGKVPQHLLELMPHLDNTKSQCQVMLLGWEPANDKLPRWILGAPFFRQYYASFQAASSKDGEHSIFISKHDGNCLPGSHDERRSEEMRVVSASKIRLPSLVQTSGTNTR